MASARKVLEVGIEIGRFLALCNSEISCFSTDFYSVCDTCDSKKTTSLLEGARYAPACARGLMLLSPLRFCCDHLVVCFVVLLCHLDMPTLHLRKKMLYTFVSQCLHCVFGDFENKSAVFRDFFTLWGFFNPYTYRRSAQCPSLHSFRIDVVCHSFKSTNYATFSSTIQLRWISSFVFSPWHNSGKLGSAHLA